MDPRVAVETTFERALQCHRAGRIGEAEILYRKTLDGDPAHHAALYSLSTLALQAGNNEMAAELLERAIVLCPHDASYHTNLGEVRRRLGLYREATQSFLQALSIKPNLAEAMHNLALVLEENAEVDLAIGYYERALDLKPGSYVFQRALAHALLKRGDLARAAGHLICASLVDPKSIDVLGLLATTLGSLGRSAGAAATARRALTKKPDLAIAHHVLGAWFMERSRFGDAASCFRRALDIDPNLAAARDGLREAMSAAAGAAGAESDTPLPPRSPTRVENGARSGSNRRARRAQAVERARTHENAGRLPAAMQAYRQALDLDPDDVDVLHALARVALRANEAGVAVECLAKAVIAAPENAACHADLGEGYQRLGQHREATEALTRALALEPDLADAAHHLGLAFAHLGDIAASLGHLEHAVDVRPDDIHFQFALARSLREAGAFERSVSHYQCSLAIDPNRVDVLVDLGTVLRRLGRAEAAAATFRRALDLEPDSASALAHLGAVLADEWRIDEAIASCRKALTVDPNLAAAHFQLGNALVGSGEIDLAIESWRRAIALDRANSVAHSNLAWLAAYSPRFDATAVLEEARAWSRQHAEPLASRIRPHDNDGDPQRRLRVGYVSGDFYDHSAAYFLIPLLGHHDHDEFEIHCYSSTPRSDRITEKLQTCADVWHDIERLGDLTAADQIRRDGIDILVDLAMHTGRGRPRLFACKPAPVQICWLAYTGTTGLSTMDYRVTDPFLDPPELGQGPYAEMPLTLPDTFWCYDPLVSEPDPGELPALSTGYVTFGCQNSFHKIHSGVLELWAGVLRAVRDSRLIAHAPAQAHARIFETLEAHGVPRQRVRLVPRRARPEYLSTYREIDIGLDTFPFNGATTSLDAFWMGVPVVTLLGSTVVGRAGLCLAMNLKLPELVATSPRGFEEAAVRLASDLPRLERLRAGLRARIQASPLMDAPRFARNLEAAYRDAWRRWCATGRSGSRPES